MDTNNAQPLRFFSLKGRIGRLRYLAYGIGVGLLCIVPAALGGILIASHQEMLGWLIIILVDLFLFVMSVIFDIRRLHDMNASAWWVLINLLQIGICLVLAPIGYLIGLIFFLVLLLVPGTMGDNRFGSAPPPNSGWVTAGAVTAFAIVPVIGIIAAIAFPAYQDYVTRSQMTEAFDLADAARHPLHMYYEQNNHWPPSLATVYQPAVRTDSVGHYVNTLDGIISSDGTYAVIVTMKAEGVNFAIRGKSMEMWSSNGGKSWSCGPANKNPVNARYLPAICRDTATKRP